MAKKPSYEELEQKVNKLEKSESYLKSILNNSQDLICISGMDGYFKYVSPAWEEILGYTQDELLSKPFLDFIHPDDHAINYEEVTKLSSGNLTIDFENRYIHKDGSILYISWRATPNPVEKILYCIGRDITKRVHMERELEKQHDNLEALIEERTAELQQEISDRKQTEERLNASEKKSRAWLEYSPICTKMVDLDFNLQYMSSAGVKVLNIDDITQFYGKPYPFDFYPESFRNRMAKNLEKVRETGEIITQEAPVVDVGGNELWFHSTLVPVNDEKGRIEYIIVVSDDTTKRKQAEEALRESEEKYRLLIENATDAIFIAQDEVSKFANPKAEEMIPHLGQ